MLNGNILNLLMNGNADPKSIAMNMLKQKAGNNPLINNALQMMDNGNTQGVEQIVRNLCKSQGINVDDVMNSTQRMFRR